MQIGGIVPTGDPSAPYAIPVTPVEIKGIIGANTKYMQVVIIIIHRGYEYSDKQLYPAGIRVSTRRAQNDAP